MKKYLALTALILLCCVSTFAQNSNNSTTHTLKGTVKTTNSEVIAGTNLYFKSDGFSRAFSADINGNFKAELPAGDYEVMINDLTSLEFKAFVKIQDGRLNPKNIEFTIQTNNNLCGLKENKTCPKPLSLPKPAYPAAAIAVGAKGEVVALIEIDKEGKVISAKIQNVTHPFLTLTSKKAAMNSLFEKDKNQEIRKIKLTYVFLDGKLEKDNLKKFRSLYRIEIVNRVEIVND